MELCHPFLSISHVVGEVVALETFGYRLYGGRIAETRLEPYVERGGENVGIENVAELTQFPARPLQRLLAAHECHGQHFRKRLDVADGRARGFGARSVDNEGADLDAIFDLRECFSDVERDEAEQPEGIERKRNRRDAEHAQHRCPPECVECLSRCEAHRAPPTSGESGGAGSAESNTICP